MKWAYIAYFAINVVLALVGIGRHAAKGNADATGASVVQVILFTALAAGVWVWWP